MLWLMAALGCNPTQTTPICVTNKTVACTCTSGLEGAQTCAAGNQWSECSCNATDSSEPEPEPEPEPEDTGEPVDTGETQPQPVQVYLLAGQSNMDGGGFVTGLPPALQLAQTDARLYWSGRGLWQGLSPASYWSGSGGEYFGPEVTFGRAMQDATPGGTVAIIKHAVGGTNLAECWYPGAFRTDANQGRCYADFLATVDAALAELDGAGQDYEIAGMAWMQGEADATVSAYAVAYGDNLANFISRVREDVSASTMPLAMGLIDCQAHCSFRDVVRAEQQTTADGDARVFAVETEDLPQNADALHFDASGQRTLGERLAAALLSTAQPQTPQPAFLFDGQTRSQYTGNFLVGYTFDVDREITVTDLGTLDYTGDGLSDGSTVAIWDEQTQALLRRATVPAQASAGTSIWGGWRFVAVEPLVLSPGRYVIGSQVYDGSPDRYVHNAEIAAAGGVSWVEGRHASGTSINYPTLTTDSAASWFGPNFLFVTD
jgi:hypothetical protein